VPPGGTPRLYDRLPPDEQGEVAAKVWEKFGGSEDELTPELAADLDRRAAFALKHPGLGTPIEEVSAEIRQRLLMRK
jgi:putative addiction module component (TIGR02574 family)